MKSEVSNDDDFVRAFAAEPRQIAATVFCLRRQVQGIAANHGRQRFHFGDAHRRVTVHYAEFAAHRKFARIQSLIRRERHRANVTFPALRFDPRRLPGAVPCLRGSFRIPQKPVPARPNQKRHQRHSQQRPPFLRSVQPNNFRFSSRQYKMIPVTTGVSTGKIFIT